MANTITHKYQVGDLIIRNNNSTGPLVFDPVPKAINTFTDNRKLMTKSIFLVLGEEFEANWIYSNFGDGSVCFLTKVLWLEKNEIVYLENWALCNCFDKFE